jgi:hypothetical protein
LLERVAAAAGGLYPELLVERVLALGLMDTAFTRAGNATAIRA